MLKLIFKIALVYAVLQYVFKIEINASLRPHIEAWFNDSEQQEVMPVEPAGIDTSNQEEYVPAQLKANVVEATNKPVPSNSMSQVEQKISSMKQTIGEWLEE